MNHSPPLAFMRVRYRAMKTRMPTRSRRCWALNNCKKGEYYAISATIKSVYPTLRSAGPNSSIAARLISSDSSSNFRNSSIQLNSGSSRRSSIQNRFNTISILSSCCIAPERASLPSANQKFHRGELYLPFSQLYNTTVTSQEFAQTDAIFFPILPLKNHDRLQKTLFSV